MNNRVKYAVSGLSLAGKAGCAFAIQYLLVNRLDVSAFAAWATVLSLGVLISVSDLGIGQYVMTSLIGRLDDEAFVAEILGNSIVVAMLLTAGAGILMYALLPQFGAVVGWLLAYVVAARIVFIPFSAHLLAAGRYHERKFVEFISYAASALLVAGALARELDLVFILLAFNFALSASGILIALRSAQLRGPTAFGPLRWARCREIMVGALPYFLHNAAGLLYYGGFIWIVSFALDAQQLAKLSVLHTLLFGNCYQAAEVLIKTRQIELVERVHFSRMELLLFLFCAAAGLLFVLGGVPMLRLYARNYEFHLPEIGVYVVFLSIELYWLLFHARLQILSHRSGDLLVSAAIRSIAFVVAVAVMAVWQPGLVPLLGTVSALSLGVLLYFRLWRIQGDFLPIGSVVRSNF